MRIKVNRQEWLKLKRQVKGWINFGSEVVVDKGSKVLTRNYINLMLRGLNSDGTKMKPVKESTMNQPIRYGGPDKRIRRNVNSDKSKPIQATGKTIKTLKSTRNGKTWTIAPSTQKATLIFEKNQKLGRDPLTVSDKQVQQMENIIIDDLVKKVING